MKMPPTPDYAEARNSMVMIHTREASHGLVYVMTGESRATRSAVWISLSWPR